MSGRIKGECNSCKNECQHVALQFSRQALTSLGFCIAQTILKETPELRIRNRNNQCRILLQRYACKCVRLEHKASGLHNSWNSCSILQICIRNYLRRPEIQNILGEHAPWSPLWAHYACIYALYVLLKSSSTNFCLVPCVLSV